MFTDICRLCLTPDDLIWIFDKKIAEPENMRNVISITTGVEIKNTDMISQKVCKKCCQITIKMFKFRTTAIKNDRELKNRLTKITNNRENGKTKQACTTSDKPNVCRSAPPPVVHPKAHESVIKLSDQYAGLKIPRSCIECDVNPSVVVDPDEVKTWFEAKRKRDIENELKRRDEEREKELEAEKLYIIRKTSEYNQNCIESDEENDSDAIIVVDDPPPETSTNVKTSHFAPITAKRRLISVESPPPKRKASVDTTSTSSHDQDPDEVCSNSSVSEKSSVSTAGGLLLSTVNESTNVHLCQICNAVIYSNKEMKNHVRKHTMCPFCKIRFRTLEAKNTHVEKDCPIRSIIDNPPSIPLVKVDEVKDVTDKYPNVFAPDQSSPSDPVSEADTTVEGITLVEAERNKPVTEIDTTLDDDVTYISDDDDEPVIVSVATPVENVVKVPEPVKKISRPRPENTKAEREVIKPKIPKIDMPGGATRVENVMKVPEPVKKISGPRPEITRKEPVVIQPKMPKFDMPGDEVLKNVDFKCNEAAVLKNLLKLVDKHQIFTKPTNADNISVQGYNDKTYSLKNIVPYLRKYKIPIELEYAQKLTVQYEDATPSREKVKDLWDPHGASMQRYILPKPCTESNNRPEGLQNTPNTKQPPVVQNKQSITPSSNAGSLLQVNQTIASAAILAPSNQVGSTVNNFSQPVNVQEPSTAQVNKGFQNTPNSKQTAVLQNNMSITSSSSAGSLLKVNQSVASAAILAPSNQVASTVNIFSQPINAQQTSVAQVNNVVSLQEAPLTQMNMLQTSQINMPMTQAPVVSQLNCMVPVQTPMVSSIHTTPLPRMSNPVLQTSQNSVANNNQTVVLNSMLSQILSSPTSNAGNNYIPSANANIVSPPPIYQYGYVSPVNSANTNSIRPPPPYPYNYVSPASSAVSTNYVSRPLYTTHSTNSSVLINNSPSIMRPPVILNNENINRQTIRVKTISELNRRVE